MQVLSIDEIDNVAGGVDQTTQIGFQSGWTAIGFGILVAGYTLTPVGAVLMIGTSLAMTASYAYNTLY